MCMDVAHCIQSYGNNRLYRNLNCLDTANHDIKVCSH